METLKVILHTKGNDKCLKNVINYTIGKDQIIKEGFGVNFYNSNDAFIQFKKTAEFFDNQNNTPVFHYIASFTQKTANTAEQAMNVTKEVFREIIQAHLSIIAVHSKWRDVGSYHSHTAVSPTNIYSGKLLYGDNKTNYKFAQRFADITGEPVMLIVKPENSKEWECPKIFTPHMNDKED